MSRFVELELLTENVKKELKKLFSEDVSGHDFLHTLRVMNNACCIQKKVGGDRYIIFLSALLHDADDKKLFPHTAGEYPNARKIMEKYKVSEDDQKSIIKIIESVSFSDGKETESLEAEIVQDADRLDALGAIGIARCFSYGAAHGRSIYLEEDSDSEKIQSGSSGIAHFHQKLLLLENMMKTPYGKEEAHKRTLFMKEYLKHFSEETGCDVISYI